MEERAARVAACRLFAGIGRPALCTYMGNEGCVVRTYPAGGTIWNETQYEHSLGVVLSGSVQVKKASADGREMLLRTLSAGQPFGVAALFSPQNAYVSRIVAGEACEVMFFSQTLVEQMVMEQRAFALDYIRLLSSRIQFLNQKLEELTGHGAAAKLAAFLAQHEQDGEVTLPCSLSELAGRLGVGRASLYRALDTLVARGAITRRGKCIRVLDAREVD